jgi:hypothetical protein
VNRPQRKHFRETDRKENTAAPIALGQTTKKTLVASIVACLSVAIATVVNICHIAYSMHVTILRLKMVVCAVITVLEVVTRCFPTFVVYVVWTKCTILMYGGRSCLSARPPGAVPDLLT